MDSIVAAIADFTHNLRFEHLPPATVHQCKRCTVDTFGVALGALDAPPVRIALELAAQAPVASGARIVGADRRTIPELAAFTNCVMARYLDGNDAFPNGGGHPSDTLWSVLAVAHLAGADGRAIITAAVIAYEIYYNLTNCLKVKEKGMDHCFYGAVAGAAGAAKVMGMDRAKIGEAISLAITPNLAIDATRYGHLSMWKGCAGGNAARNSVFAAQLAAAGMTGPEKPVEGKHGLYRLLGEFELLPFGGGDRPFAINMVTFKPYLSVAHAQTPIRTALQMSEQVNANDIERVIVHTYKWALDINASEPEKWRPATREAADHSIPYIVAAVLIDGKFSDAIYSDERLHDPRITSLIDRVEVREEPEYTPMFPGAMPCRIEVVTKRGERKVVENRNAHGHYTDPMNDEEINEKFANIAGRTLARARVKSALAALWDLDSTEDCNVVFDAVKVG